MQNPQSATLVLNNSLSLQFSSCGGHGGPVGAEHHGQKIVRQPKELLCKIGFVVKDVAEGHLCCGSAGTYNILQPDIARRLRDRKVGNIEKLAPDVIAAGNIGCITQLAAGTAIPVVHTVELIDWATGGRKPEVLMDVDGPGVTAQARSAAAICAAGI